MSRESMRYEEYTPRVLPMTAIKGAQSKGTSIVSNSPQETDFAEIG